MTEQELREKLTPDVLCDAIVAFQRVCPTPWPWQIRGFTQRLPAGVEAMRAVLIAALAPQGETPHCGVCACSNIVTPLVHLDGVCGGCYGQLVRNYERDTPGQGETPRPQGETVVFPTCPQCGVVAPCLAHRWPAEGQALSPAEPQGETITESGWALRRKDDPSVFVCREGGWSSATEALLRHPDIHPILDLQPDPSRWEPVYLQRTVSVRQAEPPEEPKC